MPFDTDCRNSVATAALIEFLSSLWHVSVKFVTGKVEGLEAWHVVVLAPDPGVDEKFYEAIASNHIDVKDYGTIIFSGWGKMPEMLSDATLCKAFMIRVDVDNCWFYNENVQGSYGRLLHIGWGQDPPEFVAIPILCIYFQQENGCSEYGDSDLLQAARKGNEQNFKLQLTKVDISVKNVVDLNGWTLLHHASFGGDILIIKTLLTMKLSVHVEDDASRKPIHIAAREGCVDAIKLFLESGVDVDVKDMYKWTPLHYATWGGHLPAVNLLLDKSADIDASDHWNKAKAIHLAAREGHTAIVEALLRRKGAVVNDTDMRGRTPLYYAAWRGQMSTVEFLVDHGADLYFKTCEELGGKMAVHLAAANGHTSIVMSLIAKSKELLDMQTTDGYTPLFLAHYMGHEGTVKFLIDEGASINFMDDKEAPSRNENVEKRYEYLSLHAAASSGDLDAVKRYIEAGFGTKHIGTESRTVLHSAALSNEKEVLQFVLKELVKKQCLHIDVPEKQDGLSPLMWAASHCKQDSVQILLESDADIDFQSKPHGNTALHLAAEKSHLEVVKILVDKGASINLKNCNHITALHNAAMNRNIAMIKFLIARNANVDMRDINGKTPLDYAGEKMRWLFKSSCSAVSKKNSTAIGGNSVAAAVAVEVKESMINVEERLFTKRGEAKHPA